MFRNMKLKTRLTTGFATILLLTLGLAAISIDRVNFINDSLTVMNDVNSVKQRYAINFRGSVHDRAISLRDVVLVGPSDELKSALADIDRLSLAYETSAVKMDEIFAAGVSVTSDEKQILDGIKDIEAKTLPLIGQVIAHREAGNPAAAHSLLMSEARPAFTEWLRRINQFIDLEEAKNKAIATDARSVAAGFQILTLLLCLGAFVIGSGIAIWSLSAIRPLNILTNLMGRLARGDFAVDVPYADRGDEVGSIAKAVRVFKESGLERVTLENDAARFRDELDSRLRASETAFEASGEAQRGIVAALDRGLTRLAEGDLTVRLGESVAPEFESLRTKFNDSVDRLEGAMSSIVTAVGAIRTGLGEISVASNDLAQRTEQQAASLEETVAALSDVTTAVNETANSAGNATASASTAQKNAEKGGEIVGRAVEAMQQIEQSSEKIGKIIGVIDEIAFQTNLLALNAGVEAARAGEAGRGFAVVAQEVRGLAQRSAEAAKEIKELISTSGAQVQQGVELVTASGKSLDEIVGQVGAMSGVVTEIARSAREQAASLREVSTAADQMDKVTQQNAAMVEQTTAAAQTLTSETEHLAALVQHFRTKSGSSTVHSTSRQSRKPVRAAPPSPAVPQMRATGNGGAAAKPQGDQESWAEF